MFNFEIADFLEIFIKDCSLSSRINHQICIEPVVPLIVLSYKLYMTNVIVINVLITWKSITSLRFSDKHFQRYIKAANESCFHDLYFSRN